MNEVLALQTEVESATTDSDVSAFCSALSWKCTVNTN